MISLFLSSLNTFFHTASLPVLAKARDAAVGGRFSCSSPGNAVHFVLQGQTNGGAERRIGPFPGCKVEQMAGK